MFKLPNFSFHFGSSTYVVLTHMGKVLNHSSSFPGSLAVSSVSLASASIPLVPHPVPRVLQFSQPQGSPVPGRLANPNATLASLASGALRLFCVRCLRAPGSDTTAGCARRNRWTNCLRCQSAGNPFKTGSRFERGSSVFPTRTDSKTWPWRVTRGILYFLNFFLCFVSTVVQHCSQRRHRLQQTITPSRRPSHRPKYQHSNPSSSWPTVIYHWKDQRLSLR